MVAFGVSLLSEFPLDWQLDLEACSDLGSAFWQQYFIDGAVQFHIRECTVFLLELGLGHPLLNSQPFTCWFDTTDDHYLNLFIVS